MRDSGPTNLCEGFPREAKPLSDLVPPLRVPPWQRPWTQGDRRQWARRRLRGVGHRPQADGVVRRPVAEDVVRDPQEMARQGNDRDLAPPPRAADAEPDRLQRSRLGAPTPGEQYVTRLHEA